MSTSIYAHVGLVLADARTLRPLYVCIYAVLVAVVTAVSGELCSQRYDGMYCKHGVNRTDSKHVSKHVNKNVDMYAYKGVLAKAVCMDGCECVGERERAAGDHWGEA